MWRNDESPQGEAESSPTWVAWVAGWSLLVGALVVVLPSYFLFGETGALVATMGVLLVSALLVWLSAEAHAALTAERRRQERFAGRPDVTTVR